jgi:ribosomal-protein-alanine N-acetyltransferase
VKTIRKAAASDAPVLASLQNSCFAERWDAGFFARSLADGATAFIVEEGGLPLGFILIQTPADESEILSLGTTAASRRRGLARALVYEAAQYAARRGAKSMFLEVSENNVPAGALYAGLGFALTGRRKAYYRDENGSHDALCLRADIPFREYP